jgi:hypothetical protein
MNTLNSVIVTGYKVVDLINENGMRLIFND